MNLEGVDIFQAETIGGAAKIPAELRYSVEVRLLRRRRQIADRHVLDHTAAKSADLSHRKLLSEGLGCEKPTILRREAITATAPQLPRQRLRSIPHNQLQGSRPLSPEIRQNP